ncbi:hypothetical protein M5K25_011006 [Dendrobium thyrsiflorum]|uniref:Uncharacterized protein n=1 Tax=Dendrobium thyrsiflorum TaxID=117978 RepID=A0ABD0V1N3_DENTH
MRRLMAGRKVEVLEGEIGQMKSEISYLQTQVSNLKKDMPFIHDKIDSNFSIPEEMLKKVVKGQTKISPSERREGADSQGSGEDPKPIRRREKSRCGYFGPIPKEKSGSGYGKRQEEVEQERTVGGRSEAPGERNWRQQLRRIVQDDLHLFDNQGANTGYSSRDFEGGSPGDNLKKLTETELQDKRAKGTKHIRRSTDVRTELFRFSPFVMTRKLRSVTSFHLEDKVGLWEGGIVRPIIRPARF